MKNTLIIIICAWSNLTAIAQGLVEFNNSPSTFFTAGKNVNYPGPGYQGTFYFGLLTSTSGLTGTFTFSGNYATNSPYAYGRFIGGTQAVNGWAPGASVFYEVAGWSASLGPTWNPGWLLGNFAGKTGFFGTSSLGNGIAGGGTPPAPPFPLFGGTGISAGFNLAPTALIPEPSSMALTGFGGAFLLIFRRKFVAEPAHAA
jgi:hypothetical protein